MFELTWQDLRSSVRSFRRTSTFTATVVITLALSIGGNVAIFSVLNGIVLKPLPFAHPDELVSIWHSAPGLNIQQLGLAPSLYATYHEQNRTFQGVGLWSASTATVTGLANPEQVETLLVTYGTLSVLGVSPVVGRRFVPGDHLASSPQTVILTYDYWQNRFGGDPAAVGRQLTVSGRVREIIGVLPRTFRFLNQRPSLIVPLQFDRSQMILGLFNYQAVARLKPRVTIADANADVARMLPIWMRSFPPAPGFSLQLFEDAHITPTLRPFKQDAVGSIASVLWIVMGTLAIVLMIACANVANLLLVRAEIRRQDLAVRIALGAGRARLAREFFVESVGLSTAGGLIGLGVAVAAVQLLARFGPAQLPRLNEISIDGVVILFAFAVSVGSGLCFGLIPIIKFAIPGSSTPGVGSGWHTASRERHRSRSALVVVQVALAVVLLIGAGLMIRTFHSLRSVNPGFDSTAEIQTFRIVIPEAQLRDAEQVVRMQRAILDKIAAIPGVVSSSLGQSVPMDSRVDHDPVITQGAANPDQQMANIRAYNFIVPGFFRTIGTPVVAGRDLTWIDVYDRRPVVMVSENLARELWGGVSAALGKQLRENRSGMWREVVGVVGDIRDEGIDRRAPATVYWPIVLDRFLGQAVMVKRSVAFAVRTQGVPPEGLLDQLQDAVWSVNRDLPVANANTLRGIYDRSMARTSFALVMLAIAGSMALLLGLVGIYAVMSYSVIQRTPEIGIRMALGAHRFQVVALIVRYSLGLTIIGVAIGLVSAALLTRVLARLLFGVTPLDPATFLLVSLVLTAVALLAAHVPARRAASLDPIAVLRMN